MMSLITNVSPRSAADERTRNQLWLVLATASIGESIRGRKEIILIDIGYASSEPVVFVVALQGGGSHDGTL